MFSLVLVGSGFLRSSQTRKSMDALESQQKWLVISSSFSNLNGLGPEQGIDRFYRRPRRQGISQKFSKPEELRVHRLWKLGFDPELPSREIPGVILEGMFEHPFS